MATSEKTLITVKTIVNAPVEKVWKLWTEPNDIMNWNNANDDWHTPEAENDLRPGGKFRYKMAAKDGSFAFDFEGIYDEVKTNRLIEYTIADGRKVKIIFEDQADGTKVTESFEAEDSHTIEMQQEGWQSILNNFRKYAETKTDFEKLHYEIEINASPEKVYHCMLDEQKYREWTAPFCPTSYYEGSWEKGSKILFIGTDEKGEKGGMVSRIKENIPQKFVSIEHLGMYKNGKEITDNEEVGSFAGGLENYAFEDLNGKTLLKVDSDTTQEFKAYLSETWPDALKKLKDICEK